jgi:hypothetical protein
VPTTWYNLLTKMGLYGEGNPRSDVVGIGVFLRQADAPDLPSGIGDAGSLVRCVALDRFLPD